VVLLILEAHCPLHFGRRVDKRAQADRGEDVVVATRVDEFEFARLVEAPLGVAAGEEKPNLHWARVQRVFFSA